MSKVVQPTHELMSPEPVSRLCNQCPLILPATPKGEGPVLASQQLGVCSTASPLPMSTPCTFPHCTCEQGAVGCGSGQSPAMGSGLLSSLYYCRDWMSLPAFAVVLKSRQLRKWDRGTKKCVAHKRIHPGKIKFPLEEHKSIYKTQFVHSSEMCLLN